MNLRGVSTFRSPDTVRPGTRRLSTRRRAVLGSTLVTVVLAAVGVAPAAAAPKAAPGHKVCSISDDRIDSVSGLTATDDGYAVVNDTGGQVLTVYQLDSKCKVSNVLTDPQGRTTNSPQDVAAGKNGTLWVGDIGDTSKSRQTIAVWKIPSGNAPTQLYRMSYPSGTDPVDAKSLLMQPDGTPIVVTYQAGVGKVYEPAKKLSANATTPLKSIGSIKLTATGTPGGSIGPGAQRVFTGGAVSPDGTHAVLRTFTDAYQWKVKGGDVAKSIVSGTPVRTPLPNEPSGQAITYDGSSFLTVSNTADTSAAPTIEKYAPAAAPAPSKESDGGNDAKGGGGLFSGNINLADIKNLVIVVGVLGLILVIVGIVGIRRARRRGGSSGPGDAGGPDGRPRPSGPGSGPNRRRAPSENDVETAYIPRVDERAESRLRGEAPPGRRDAPRAQQPPVDETPEPSRARPYLPPVDGSMRRRRRRESDEEPTLSPGSGRRGDDEPTLSPRSERRTGDGPRRSRRSGAAEPSAGRRVDPAELSAADTAAIEKVTDDPGHRGPGAGGPAGRGGGREYGGAPDRARGAGPGPEYGGGPDRARGGGQGPEYGGASNGQYDGGPARELAAEPGRDRGRRPGRQYGGAGRNDGREYGGEPGRNDGREYGGGPVRNDGPEYGGGPGRADGPGYGAAPAREYGGGRGNQYGRGQGPPADASREAPRTPGRSRRPRDEDDEIDWLDDLR